MYQFMNLKYVSRKSNQIWNLECKSVSRIIFFNFGRFSKIENKIRYK